MNVKATVEFEWTVKHDLGTVLGVHGDWLQDPFGYPSADAQERSQTLVMKGHRHCQTGGCFSRKFPEGRDYGSF
jgi:hypothetical protein